MLSLPQVLYEAQRHSIDEIQVEPGAPVTLHGEQGALVLGDALRASEISEALSQVLGPDQQAELAVAGVVTFYVEGYAEWDLVAESAQDGVVIRGRMREGDSPHEHGVPLDLPPLRPFQPDGSDGESASGAVPRPIVHQNTRWDLGIAVEPFDDAVSSGEASASAGSLLPDRGHASFADTIDFALVGRSGPDHDEPEPVPRIVPDIELSMERTVAQVGPARPSVTGAVALVEHARAVEPGTVVYLAGIGMGEALLEALGDGFDIIDDESWATVTTRPFSELPVGWGYLVRLEDPSRCLPWLLRRVEEGARVVVEGRARTSAGARRTLLGAEATPQLVQWLDAHPQQWLCPDGSGWRLDSM